VGQVVVTFQYSLLHVYVTSKREVIKVGQVVLVTLILEQFAFSGLALLVANVANG